MNRTLKRRVSRIPGQQGFELENHLILRLPEEHAKQMRELLVSPQSSNIKDRLNIQLDHAQDKEDMRNGIITIDTRMFKARLCDMPTVLETWKTIDGKNFYKTADVCQMLMVREKDDSQEEEEIKKKKKDHPNRVDKKYLWPHGYTPPLKNVRKRRFRKVLRKKQILELPEIEKEVKRLLRADEEAYSVKWEVLKEEEEKGHSTEQNANDTFGSKAGGFKSSLHSKKDKGRTPANLDEQLFGEMVSSSEDEMLNASMTMLDDDEDSRMSMEDSRASESYSQQQSQSTSHTVPQMSVVPTASLTNVYDQQYSSSSMPSVNILGVNQINQKEIDPPSSLPTEFNPSMFSSDEGGTNSQNMESQSVFRDSAELSTLEQELSGLIRERTSLETHMDSLDNQALKSRFLNKLQDINNAIEEKQNEIDRVRHPL